MAIAAAPKAVGADDGDLIFRVGDEGFISTWLTLGPFVQRRGLSVAELARMDPLSGAQIEAAPRQGTFRKKGTWEALYTRKPNASFTGRRPAVVYLAAVLDAPTSDRLWLAAGSDGPVTVWLNGKEVLYRDAKRRGLPDTDLVPLDVSRGENRLVVKLANDRPGPWRLFARLMNRDFSPARSVNLPA